MIDQSTESQSNHEDHVTFQSTRSDYQADFWETLVQGLAPDGGLFVPKKFPSPFSSDFFTEQLPTLDLPQISAHLLRKFIPTEEITDSKLQQMMNKAHNFDIPLQTIDKHTFVAWLDRGPTASFKDIAARAIAQLLEAYCAKNQVAKNIVVATSGDTGVAIASAFADSTWITVTVLYPADGVSEVQEKQMLDVHYRYDNIQVIPVPGNFDDCQNTAKLLFAAREADPSDDASLTALSKNLTDILHQDLDSQQVKDLINTVHQLDLSSANSINIWRLIPQMTQYYSAYSQLVTTGQITPNQKITFAVPTGNVGHLMAGIYARQLGLPINKFVVGTNQNNIVSNLIGYCQIKHSGFINTLAPSMDILDPSNLERLLTLTATETETDTPIDFLKMKEAIRQLDPSDPTAIPIEQFGVTATMMDWLRDLLWTENTETDQELVEIIQRIHQQTDGQIVLEPHGAAACNAALLAHHKNFLDDQEPVVILETAHPHKFPQALQQANLPGSNRPHPQLDQLDQLSLSDLTKPDTTHLITDIANQIKKISDRAASTRG